MNRLRANLVDSVRFVRRQLGALRRRARTWRRPVGMVAADRRLLGAERASLGTDVAVLGESLAVRQALPDVRLDVIGTDPFDLSVTVSATVSDPARCQLAVGPHLSWSIRQWTRSTVKRRGWREKLAATWRAARTPVLWNPAATVTCCPVSLWATGRRPPSPKRSKRRSTAEGSRTTRWPRCASLLLQTPGSAVLARHSGRRRTCRRAHNAARSPRESHRLA